MTPPLAQLQNQLIISCQAPVNSPLHQPAMIAAMAQAACNQGAAAIRVDTPAHVRAVKAVLPHIPIIGLWKQTLPGSSVYITPRWQEAEAIIEAGAEIIAIDATDRPRPDGQDLAALIDQIHRRDRLVMADIDTVANGIAAAQLGADLVGTTLYGYTEETQGLAPPGYDLLRQLRQQISVHLICEGGIASPSMVAQAFELGADAVVVGTAITGIDLQVQAFKQSCP
ncbi:MAG: N-acetylmannosamine-6-phosphate 2-epimerase [Synechococcaceae cyanobacterium RL_1_2]|nr:N-acetylmannosamine-6-phosphate 2-epimerase [Synechococcaceae cyanobacterium RL_1_2]